MTNLQAVVDYFVASTGMLPLVSALSVLPDQPAAELRTTQHCTLWLAAQPSRRRLQKPRARPGVAEQRSSQQQPSDSSALTQSAWQMS